MCTYTTYPEDTVMHNILLTVIFKNFAILNSIAKKVKVYYFSVL